MKNRLEHMKKYEEPFMRLKKARVSAGYASGKAFASENGFSVTNYYQKEGGHRGITKRDAYLYGRALGVSQEWILDGKTGDGEDLTLTCNLKVLPDGEIQVRGVKMKWEK